MDKQDQEAWDGLFWLTLLVVHFVVKVCYWFSGLAVALWLGVVMRESLHSRLAAGCAMFWVFVLTMVAQGYISFAWNQVLAKWGPKVS
jgi:hypothetical protein